MSRGSRLFGAILLGCLSLLRVASFAETSTSGSPVEVDTLPAIAGHFESRIIPEGNTSQEQTREWYLWRQPNQVETRETSGDTGQIWELSRNGQVSYLRIFHQEKRIIEYTSGDLRALQSYPGWLKLACLIDPILLKTQLQLNGSVETLGRQAQRYQGRVDEVEFEVLWLEKERIPALVRQMFANRQEIMQLKEIHSLHESPWPRSQISEYIHIDYADLGDKEADPFIHSLQQGVEHAH